MTTLVDTQALDNILREHLVAEVKKHLVKLIDTELESIARDAVVRFMDIEVATINNKDMVKLKKLTIVHGQLTRDYEDLQYYSNVTFQKLEAAKVQIEVASIHIARHKKTLSYCMIVILGLIALNIAQFIY